MALDLSLTVLLTLTLRAVFCNDVFYIGGLFPLSVEDQYFKQSLGEYPKMAAELAVEDSSGILSPYNVSVKLEVADSGCNSETAISSYVDFVQSLRSKSQGNFCADKWRCPVKLNCT